MVSRPLAIWLRRLRASSIRFFTTTFGDEPGRVSPIGT
jgi:hypothetical protein